eukprot:scaffold2423_cov113-Isochrysis_galbana.AAC.24
MPALGGVVAAPPTDTTPPGYIYTYIYMLPPRSYRPPIATRGPRVATRGRKLPRSSLGFRGALW